VVSFVTPLAILTLVVEAEARWPLVELSAIAYPGRDTLEVRILFPFLVVVLVVGHSFDKLQSFNVQDPRHPHHRQNQ
jgi:hypothetical protein